MPQEERRPRMDALRRHVVTNDISTWIRNVFATVEALREPTPKDQHHASVCPPPTVEDRRAALRERFADAAGALLCLDFDGTLAPIVDQPDEAGDGARLQIPVGSLAEDPSVDVAVISGRAIDDLRGRVDVDGVVYAGNHGLELQRRDQTEIVPRPTSSATPSTTSVPKSRQRRNRSPAPTSSTRGVTATVHYRQVSEKRVPEVVEAVDASVADVAVGMDATGEPFEVLAGKQIREIRPASTGTRAASSSCSPKTFPTTGTSSTSATTRPTRTPSRSSNPGTRRGSR